METPGFIALAQQNALRRQMDVIANNVANVNTSGYRAQRMQFVEFLERASPSERYSMPIDLVTSRDLRQGPLQQTDNPLDVAIEGDGYFVVQTLQGERYTRSGQFRMDTERRLVDGGGLPVLGDAGPIVIPENASQITVSATGDISTDVGGVVGRLRVVQFDSEQQLEMLGGGLYATDQTPRDVEQRRIAQGFVEGSNVQPVVEMTRMIDVLRQYQSTQRMLDSEHERQRTAIRQLPRATAA